MKHFKRIFSGWLTLALCLTMLLGSAHGAVLCIEDSGRISVETSQKIGFCGPAAVAVNEVISHQEYAHCSSCIDIPISISSLGNYIVKPQQVNSHHDFVILPDTTITASAFTMPTAHTFLTPANSGNNNTLASLRSVIILV